MKFIDVKRELYATDSECWVEMLPHAHLMVRRMSTIVPKKGSAFNLARILLICTILLHASIGVSSRLFNLQKRQTKNESNIGNDYNYKSLIDFGDTKVSKFVKYENVAAVALENGTIIAYNLMKNDKKDPTLNEIWRYNLNKNDTQLNFREFKLINKNVLLFCSDQLCQTCNFEKHDKCTSFSLAITGTTIFASMQGSLVDENRLILRTVASNTVHNGAIYTLQPTEMGSLINQALDRNGIEDVITVGSFSTESHTFFIGSASKIDVPYNIFTGDKQRRRRIDLRVTRVCNNDATKRLESRMDVALSCNGLDSGDGYENSSSKRAKIASLSPDGARLLILFENNINQVTENVACEFDVNNLKTHFDKTWRTCQRNTDAANTVERCKVDSAEMKNDENCYIFAWARNARVPLCERFQSTSQIGNDFIDSCNLSAFKTNANRNYWLENYQPFMGQIIMRITNEVKNISGITEGVRSDIIYITRTSKIERFTKTNQHTNTTLLTIPIKSSNTPAIIDIPTNSLFFTDENKLKYVRQTCEDLYPKCEQISWSDPLKCGWCADEMGKGHTFSFLRPESCSNGQALDKCPPNISEVSYELGRYMIVGHGFNNIENLKLRACDEECTIDHKLDILLSCEAKSLCQLELNGRVGKWRNFRLILQDHLNKIPNEFAQSAKNNSRLVRILVTMVVLFLLFTILIIVWKLYNKYADRIRVKVQQNAEKAPKGKYMSVSTGEFGGADGLAPYSCQQHIHSHHTYPHMSFSGISTSNSVSGLGAMDEFGAFKICDVNLSSRNRIDQTRIFLIKQIGDGNSSTVHLAKYVMGSDANVSQRVAVKTICNAAFNMADIMREIELISKCRHKNIVEYIGHYEDQFGRMHIVTEYMAGGDLHKFLISPANKLTVGEAFLFILQICEGMEYITKQHIVHRDLAARNCMLDDDNLVVKITDFGLCRTSNINYEYISENVAQQLPFRWTAIECFGTNRKFSEKSDVWSFGVVVWEIFARDLTPYAGKDSNGVREYLKAGNRLEFERIPSCPQEIYERVLLPCWEESPHDRPTFTELRIEIEKIYWGVKNSCPEYLKTEYETPISLIGSPTPMLEIEECKSISSTP